VSFGSSGGSAVDFVFLVSLAWFRLGDRPLEKRFKHEGVDDFIFAKLPHRDFYDVSQSKSVENIRDRVSHIEHQYAQAAVLFVRATTAFVGGLTDAGDRGKRAINQPYNLANGNVFRWPSQKVAAMFPAPALEVTGSFELHQDLFEEFDWEPFFWRKFAHLEQRTADGLSHTKVNQSAEGVFASFG
jgi:hypothetical protein